MMMSKELSAKDIDGTDDRNLKQVEIPEWGGHAWIRVLTAQDRDKLELMLTDGKGNTKNVQNPRAQVVAKALCDARGNRLFQDSDIEKLGLKSSIVIDRLFTEILVHNAIRNEDVEALQKN